MINTEVWEQFDPNDGYHCVYYARGEAEVSLHIGLIAGGDWEAFRDHIHSDGQVDDLSSVEVYKQCNVEPVDLGRVHRLRMVMDSLCRYFNCGGSWEELEPCIAASKEMFLGGLYVEGWHYLVSAVNEDGFWEHIWVADEGTGVVKWEHGICIYTGLTLSDLDQELSGEDGQQEEAEFHPRLEHRQGSEAEVEVDGGGLAAVRE